MTRASLPMYDWPECRAETDADWDMIRAAAPVELPEALTRPDNLHEHWRDPALVFSQTCWGPLSLGLIDALLPLAQPDYSRFDGGRGPFYRSAIITREGVAAPVPGTAAASLPPDLLVGRRFALNAGESLSGFLSLAADLGADPRILAAESVETGSHRASVQAVAKGRADIAAIDCRSWHLARRFEPCAARLTVIGWTAERPGLPYVTSRTTAPEKAAAMRKTLLTMGCHRVAEGDEE
jgi:ABC-type phosphate/phosphonate transport system substrate-binding protein